MAFIEPFGVGQMGRLVMLVCQHRTKEDFPLMLAGQRVRMPFIMPSCGHLLGPDLLLVYSVVLYSPYFLSSMIVFQCVVKHFIWRLS